ncbi:nitrate reductase subunit alpha [Bacillus sp. FJAT-49711]|uniref:nitrate reductase subunit alpha n=1 Tax=Bacillus sp. FJAT-49711 TaxID=2833585 RepID=UPI001BC94DD1|nr:nitrate reductase subunit alpha [Bacillus sp. FJAT-49711]MBS4219730.1 nitrate reductase subunit alpha [Bacillus sp. FJAT-49711]
MTNISKASSPFWKKLKFFGKTVPETEHSEMQPYDRGSERIYRRRWQHDKVVRTTHGVNCTGSCSWKVHVKDGIITWETQQTDYPSTGPDMPEFEPRGCQRGATFSWYTYSPLRIRYPYIRGSLLTLWRKALEETKDPVAAWKSIAEDEEKSKEYKKSRGKGGLIRTTWDEMNTLISASLIHTIQEYGPDRIFGFSPIPAMSMVSYAAGGRFLSLLGGSLLSFYDWYADLPNSSPQVWGDQTDVPESSDWFNSSYIIAWGSNIPQTRTPDSHFYVESRYRGTKVVAVAPDYAEYVKFADNWLPVKVGMDGALAMAMTHVILKEFYVDQQVDFFNDYIKTYTDMPFLITLKEKDGGYVGDKFLRASDLRMSVDKAEWKPVLLDKKTGEFAIPNGTVGHRWDEKSNWNLKLEDRDNGLGDIDPELTLLGQEDEVVMGLFPYFGEEQEGVLKRGLPVKKVSMDGKSVYVTTVFDLMMANSAVGRGLPGDYATSYEDDIPYTPAWQEKLTGVDKYQAAQIAREFAQNAIDSEGRSMIIMGAGINHWYHSDTIYRSILNLVMLTGCQGRNGGGWAHYVGQEKVRPIEGWSTIAMAKDWGGPPRLMNGTSFFYFATEQWRYEDQRMENLKSPLVDKSKYNHPGDYNVLAARLGWLPSYPQFNKSSLKMGADAQGSNDNLKKQVAEQLKNGQLKFAVENPEDRRNFPKVLFVWRANLIGSSAKGHEYFLKHLLGTHDGTLSTENEQDSTEEINWVKEMPEGKLDLMVSADFRMCSTGLYSDILLPAATWYEKYDISSTDMHPFVHPFNPAITPPWEAKSDWETFRNLAKRFSMMAKHYLPEVVQDAVATPLGKDSPDEISQAYGRAPDWKHGEFEPTPGVNLPKVQIVERDYTKVFDKFVTLGPNATNLGAHGIGYKAEEAYEKLFAMLGPSKYSEHHKDKPNLFTDKNAAEAMLTLSSATNGSLAVKAWETLEKQTGQQLKDLSSDREGEHITFFDITAQPRKVITTPVFTGINKGNRRYSPFTQNIERLVPFRTLTGRQHFYLDHDIMLEFGEELPTFKAPLKKMAFYDKDNRPVMDGQEITLKYLTPHFKWSYHSTYGDTLPMLTLFRGGPHVWLNNEDAKSVGLDDNDWIQMYNRNGVVVARTVVSHRIPRGVAFMYHVQERYINVPGSPITNQRGGTFNSPTRIHMKPTQMIGGYAQLSYGFNYYGPTGNQRDEQVVIRKLERDEVKWLEN